ncbi:MAG: SurA N-terminal domain-containing protein [Nitrospirae bacterium]|nr:SurA N-terminal domain-containing protein [Nitrospirota bacterium]
MKIYLLKRFFILAVVLSLVIAGCAKKEEKKTGQYLVKINDVTITKEYLDKKIESLPPMAQKMFEGEEGMTKLIENLINQKVLYLEAKKKGIDNDPEYKKNLEDSKEMLLIQSLLKKEMEAKIKVSDKEVKDFYEKNKANLIDKSGKPVEFEKIKDMLAQRLSAQKENEVFESYLEGLKKSYKIDINKDAIAGLSKPEGSGKEESKEVMKERPKKEEPKKETLKK